MNDKTNTPQSRKTYAQIMAEQVNSLVGAEITEAFITPEDEYTPEGYGFKINLNGKEKLVFVLMDEEGNGPGHLDIQNI